MEQRAVNPSEGESKAKSITFVKSYNRKHDRREQSKEGGTQIQCWVSNSGEEHGDDRKGEFANHVSSSCRILTKLHNSPLTVCSELCIIRH